MKYKNNLLVENVLLVIVKCVYFTFNTDLKISINNPPNLDCREETEEMFVWLEILKLQYEQLNTCDRLLFIISSQNNMYLIRVGSFTY